MQIGKITKADCQKIINEMMEAGKKHSTMSNLKSCLNAVFESAVDDDTILKNPAKNLKITQTESKKRTAIEQRHINIFMDYLKNNVQYSYVYPEFVALFNLGLRIGEMAALTWQDVDFKENVITINKTVNRYRKADYGFTIAVASPKSKTSIREIPMNSVVRSTLLKLRMQRGENNAQLNYVDDSGHNRGIVSGFVFVNSIGNVWTEPAFRDMIKRIVGHLNREAEKNKTEQLADFCPHMARHTYISLAYSAGADAKIVSEIVGHTSVSTTLNVYAHLSEDKRREQEAVVQQVKIS